MSTTHPTTLPELPKNHAWEIRTSESGSIYLFINRTKPLLRTVQEWVRGEGWARSYHVYGSPVLRTTFDQSVAGTIQRVASKVLADWTRRENFDERSRTYAGGGLITYPITFGEIPVDSETKAL